MKKLLLALTLAVGVIATINARTNHITSLNFQMKASQSEIKTGLVLYPDDVVFIWASGKATYGPLAKYALGALNGAGSNSEEYRAIWNKETYSKENFGAIICSVGQTGSSYYPLEKDFKQCLTNNFEIGTCAITNDPIAGTMLKVKQTGELRFEINDLWTLDNDGEFRLSVVIFSSKILPYQYSQYQKADNILCNVLMGINGTSYDAQQMLLVAKYGSTSSLKSLGDINSFYRFLNEHTLIRQSGVRWQQVAIEVTGLLLLVTQLLEELKKPTFIPEIDSGKFAFLALYLLLTSQHGKKFVDGTASAGLVQDITQRFYGPIIRNEVKVKDPFYFDFVAVYAEQFHPELQSYYRNFNFFDKLMVEGIAAQWYAGRSGCMNTNDILPTNETFRIGQAQDRLKVGLYKMGYSWNQINVALAHLDVFKRQQLGYDEIISELSSRALVPVR